jgi:hypothetical protein
MIQFDEYFVLYKKFFLNNTYFSVTKYIVTHILNKNMNLRLYNKLNIYNKKY